MFPQKIISFLVVSLVLTVACISLSTFGIPLGAPLVIALPIMLFLIVSPRRALLFAWGCLSLLPFLVRMYLGNSAYHIVNEGVVLLVWVAWIARILMDGGLRGIPAPLKRIGALILAVSFVSLIVNKVSPVYWGEWVLTYLLPLPVIAISRTYLKDYSPKRLLRIIIVFLLVQFVLNMTWHAGVNPLHNNSLAADLSCGTYGNTAATGYIMLAAIVGGMCFFVSSKQYFGARFGAILLILLACIQFVFTFTVHAYLLVPVALLVFIFFFPRAQGQGPGKAIYLLLVLSFVFLAIVPLVSKPSANSRHRHTRKYSTEYGKKAWRSVWHGPKVNVIRRVVKTANPVQLMVGMGPNSAVSYTGLLLDSPQTIRLIGEWYYTASGRREIGTGSIRENIFSGTAMLLSEIGIIGAVLYLMLLVYPLLYIVRRVKYDKTISAEMRFMIGFVVMLLIINLVIGIVWDVWRIRMLATGIWLLFGRIMDPEDEAEALVKSNDGAKMTKIVRDIEGSCCSESSLHV